MFMEVKYINNKDYMKQLMQMLKKQNKKEQIIGVFMLSKHFIYIFRKYSPEFEQLNEILKQF